MSDKAAYDRVTEWQRGGDGTGSPSDWFATHTMTEAMTKTESRLAIEATIGDDMTERLRQSWIAEQKWFGKNIDFPKGQYFVTEET